MSRQAGSNSVLGTCPSLVRLPHIVSPPLPTAGCPHTHNPPHPSLPDLLRLLITYSLLPPSRDHYSHIPLLLLLFHMNERQQSSKENSYQVITLPNAVPSMPHDQATMLHDRVVSSIYHFSPWHKVLTVVGRSRFTPHQKYHTMKYLCPRWRPIRLAVNHTVRVMHNTMDQCHLHL